MAIPAGLEPATYCLEGSCSIQLSYGTVGARRPQYSAFGGTARAPLKRASMRPLADAVELEIVGVGDRAALRLLGLLDPVGDALAGRVGDRLLLRVEPQLHLLARVAGRRPAHQRLDLARLDAGELEQPLLRPGLAGLHRGLGGLVDAGGGHRSVSLSGARRWSGRQDLNLRPSAPKADALPGCATPRHRQSACADRHFHDDAQPALARRRVQNGN